ncbi:APC family permease [Streptomyces sp. NPDC002082]|uniref:APC family permease n=1 Tax=Streptomyces sp. NPDC002082 TaxID=3154772 RepID=UPI0033319A65
MGDVLGAGVYVLIGEVAAKSGGAVWVPLTVALLLALLTAASYAELATKYPRAGGASYYATRAYGPVVGFFTGFCMLAAGLVSVAALARGFAGEYLTALVSLPVETGGLLLVVGLGVWIVARGDGDVGRLTQLGTDSASPAAAVLAGAVLAYYSFVGFETSVNVPRRRWIRHAPTPAPLFGALATAGIVYAAVGAAASAALPTATLAASDGPLLEVVRAAGAVPPRLFAFIALVAVANGALLTGIMSSRLAFGMAREGLLPMFLTRVLPVRRTPWAAIAATTVVSALLAASRRDRRALAVVFAMVWPTTLVLAAVVLRGWCRLHPGVQ